MTPEEAALRDLWLARLAAGRESRLVVLTGSMAPLLCPGEELLVAPAPGRLLPGDLAVFTEGERFVCHRLLLPLGGGRWLQKGDANPAWERLDRGQVVGLAAAVLAGGRRHDLQGRRFLVLNSALFAVVMLRDLARRVGRLLPPAGRFSERLLSRAAGTIIARMRRPGGRDAHDRA